MLRDASAVTASEHRCNSCIKNAHPNKRHEGDGHGVRCMWGPLKGSLLIICQTFSKSSPLRLFCMCFHLVCVLCRLLCKCFCCGFVAHNTVSVVVQCFTGFTHLRARVCVCICICWVCVNLNKKKSALVSVSVPRAWLSHDQLTWFYVAKEMACFRVQLNAQLCPVTLGHVCVAMVTASRVTLNERSALGGCTKYFSLCLCIKLEPMQHLFTQRRLLPFRNGVVSMLESHLGDGSFAHKFG